MLKWIDKADLSRVSSPEKVVRKLPNTLQSTIISSRETVKSFSDLSDFGLLQTRISGNRYRKLSGREQHLKQTSQFPCSSLGRTAMVAGKHNPMAPFAHPVIVLRTGPL